MVPEATMDENDLAPAGKDYVRLTGQVMSMESVPIPERVKEPAHDHLRTSVLATDCPHGAASNFGATLLAVVRFRAHLSRIRRLGSFSYSATILL